MHVFFGEECYMATMQEIQERLWQNKLAKGFNVTNVEREFNYTYAELAEAYEAYRKAKENVGAELADVIFYVMSLAKMLDVDLEKEMMAKLKVNEERTYVDFNGHHIRVNDELK